jgi:mannose-6-phosphate isomerase-like protein (cupin superfamily)
VDDNPSAAQMKPKYTVKDVETIMSDANARARIFTLAPGQEIPWHRHSEITDHYFVLGGALTIKTRHPESQCELYVGERHQITPRTGHLLSNQGTVDCQFLLLQGGGSYDWVKLAD